MDSYTSPNNFHTSSAYSTTLSEPKLVNAPCQNCGKMVQVMIPFVGCVFCSDCARGTSIYEANSEDFKVSVK